MPDNVGNTDGALGRAHRLHCILLAKASHEASPDPRDGKADVPLDGKSGSFFANAVGVGLEACGWFCKPSLAGTSFSTIRWSPARMDHGRLCWRAGLSPAVSTFLATFEKGTQVLSQVALMTEQSGGLFAPWG